RQRAPHLGIAIHFLNSRNRRACDIAGLAALGQNVGDSAADFDGMTDADAGERIGIGTVIGLGPAVERMLMALGAFNAHAHERGRGQFRHLFESEKLIARKTPPKQIEAIALGVTCLKSLPRLLGNVGFTTNPGWY